MNQLKGKAAIVTGGTRGIGRAIAAALLSEGVDVAICGRDEAPRPTRPKRSGMADRRAR